MADSSSSTFTNSIADTTFTFFKTTYDKFIFVLTLSILFISIITIADAIKSTIEVYVPKTSSKLGYKYLIGFVLIILGVIVGMVFGKTSFKK